MGYNPDDDVAETLDRAEAMVFEVAEHRVTGLDDARVPRARADDGSAREPLAREGNLSGVPTGYTDLDTILSGSSPRAW